MEHSADARYSDDPSGEERYRVLADLTSDGVVLADRAGRFVEINPTLCAMLGYSRTELLQLGWSEIIVGAALASEQVDLDDLCLGERGERHLRARGGRD
ncbi:MAG: PAS domain S-box protein, partial [Oscillochloris sp.]|nr:PAS domain S-box protein [Oscillochloris sp.]